MTFLLLPDIKRLKACIELSKNSLLVIIVKSTLLTKLSVTEWKSWNVIFTPEIWKYNWIEI